MRTMPMAMLGPGKKMGMRGEAGKAFSCGKNKRGVTTRTARDKPKHNSSSAATDSIKEDEHKPWEK